MKAEKTKWTIELSSQIVLSAFSSFSFHCLCIDQFNSNRANVSASSDPGQRGLHCQSCALLQAAVSNVSEAFYAVSGLVCAAMPPPFLYTLTLHTVVFVIKLSISTGSWASPMRQQLGK